MEEQTASVTIRVYPSDRIALNKMIPPKKPGKRQIGVADIVHDLLAKKNSKC